MEQRQGVALDGSTDRDWQRWDVKYNGGARVNRRTRAVALCRCDQDREAEYLRKRTERAGNVQVSE